MWRLFKSGDDRVFVFIYRKFADALYNLGLQCAPREDAMVKDCLQDFFIYLREKKEKLADTDNIRLYLYKFCRRRVIAEKKLNRRYIFQDVMKDSFAVDLLRMKKL